MTNLTLSWKAGLFKLQHYQICFKALPKCWDLCALITLQSLVNFLSGTPSADVKESSSRSDRNIPSEPSNLIIGLMSPRIYKKMLNFYFCHKAFNHTLNLESHQRGLHLSVCLNTGWKLQYLQKRNLCCH